MSTQSPSLRLTLARTRRLSGGFTLVEMMVVLAVLGILFGIAVPASQSFLTSTRLTTAANDVLLGLTLARSEAVRRNTTVFFCLSTTNGGWSVHRVPGEGIREGILPSTVRVEASNLDMTSLADSACVRFRPDGLAYGAGSALMTDGQITLSIGASNRVVNIRTGGAYVG
ncbi:hypothetical protein CJ010_18200 [Azoarcus sp. DD4]|uniref:GspH/FimT family pseudopilin n=1 Tax=Azoarcus sp. DD4 TaxID=2027405 RepID=UPI0011646EC0|nr:GspH/FimT family pseudopilin [Azoarcus sp. DD4]QDF98332.1 hypothetical protein CJ010_18200 [Azoarcus sp. DD4]